MFSCGKYTSKYFTGTYINICNIYIYLCLSLLFVIFFFHFRCEWIRTLVVKLFIENVCTQGIGAEIVPSMKLWSVSKKLNDVCLLSRFKYKRVMALMAVRCFYQWHI